jgi:lysine 2,3-aminomutase
MAASTHGVFVEQFSPFLLQKLQDAREAAADSRTVEILERQYLRDPREDVVTPGDVSRHYEAAIPELPGVERIYRSTALVQPTTTCAAHCRWCLRAYYEPLQMSPEQIEAFARYCGHPDRAHELTEVLVTGGDPLLVPKKIELLLELLARHAPNIHTFRVGTRVPLQAPERIDESLLEIFRAFASTVELAVHVNHSLELFPEVIDALERIRRTGVRMYNHTVLLRGVNDTAPDLVALCDRLRSLGIESHYLFHCIPMAGMHHHRTSVARGLALARELSSGGSVSGRSRPVFALLTAVGKVVPYEGAIAGREGTRLLIRTEYDAAERVRMNPSWQMPEAAFTGPDGRLMVWYEDGTND